MRLTRKQIIIIVGIILAAIIGFYIFQKMRFSLVEARPQGRTSSVSEVVFRFNRSLDEAAQTHFTIEPNVPGNVTIKDKTITFTPIQSYKINTQYTARLGEVTARDGSKLRNLETVFTPTFVAFNELSQADRDRQEALSDPLDRQDSILSKLPYTTHEFSIDYDLVKNEQGQQEPILRVKLFAILNHPDQLAAYKQQIADYKHKAIEWIDQNNQGKFYQITFEPDVDPEPTSPEGYTGDGVPPEEQPH